MAKHIVDYSGPIWALLECSCPVESGYDVNRWVIDNYAPFRHSLSL